MSKLLMKYITLIEGVGNPLKFFNSKVEKACDKIYYHFMIKIINILWK